MIRPRVTSDPRILITYSCDSMPSSSWMRTRGITIPSSLAIWRRTIGPVASERARTRASRAAVDKRHEAEPDRELERVDADLGDRLLGRRGGPAASAPSCSVSAPGRPLRTAHAIAPKIAAMNRNGSFGSPGISAKHADRGGRHHRRLALVEDLVGDVRAEVLVGAARVTMMPVATEISSAGI